MKNALLLHGTNNTPQGNWFPWLKNELEELGYKVWAPQLPHAEKPNLRRYAEFLLSNKDWQFNQGSIIVGHSSGAVAVLGLLMHLPEGAQVDTCYLVSAFKDDLDWDSLKEVFVDPLDFPKIKKRAKKFIFIHADNDPYCPLEHAQYLSKQVGGELIVRPGQKHFNTNTFGPEYKEFPFLLELIKSKV
jgi:uncharacterized protein